MTENAGKEPRTVDEWLTWVTDPDRSPGEVAPLRSDLRQRAVRYVAAFNRERQLAKLGDAPGGFRIEVFHVPQTGNQVPGFTFTVSVTRKGIKVTGSKSGDHLVAPNDGAAAAVEALFVGELMAAVESVMGAHFFER